MKRKITQIGRFFAMVALMLGAASWASAEKAPAPKIGKIYKAVQEWDLSTPDAWAADTLKIAAGGTDWTMTQSGGRRATGGKAYNDKGELLLSTGGDPLEALKGLKIENATSSSWGPTLRVKMDNGGVNMIQCNRESKIGFVESLTVGQIIEIWVNSLGSGNVGRGVNPSKSTGVKPVDPDAPAVSVEGTPDVIYYFEVTDANPVIYSTNSIGVVRVRVWEKQAEPVDTLHVAYVGDADKAYEPAYTALDKASKVEGNKVKIDYFDIATYTAENLPTAETFGDYDVLVLGSTVNPAKAILNAFANNVIGTLPVVNTRAFWYGTDRLGWAGQNGSNADGTDEANYVLPETPYKHHPIFEGLVNAENIDADTIFVFEKKRTTNGKRYMQGYPDKVMNEDAPVHTALATSADKGNQSAGRLISVAEFWRTSNPYVLVGLDIELKLEANGGPIYPTTDGDQLLVNAVNYAANAFAPFQPSNLGTCGDPKITFEKVKAQGNDSDTLRYVLRIEVAKQHDVTQNKDTFPTVTVTIGSLAAKTYDFAHPDTLWEPCTVKAKATALLYNDSEEVSAEFTNPGLRKLDAPEAVFTKQGETVRNVLTFKETIYSLDGEQVAPTIKYSLDGSDNLTLTYDPLKPDTVWETTQVKAQASLYLHLSSAVSDTTWRNPDVQAVANPTIVAEANADYPGGCLMTVTITTTTEGADIYYTLDGSQANRNSYRYENPFYVENIDSVTIKAIAVKDLFTDSEEVVYGIAANTTSEPLAVPTINITDNSFEITGSGRGDIYYTMDGSEPSATNGLKYTDKVTYLSGSYTIKAIAQGYGYKPSAASEGTAFNPTAEAPVFGKTIYKSTFNRNDPSVKLEDDPDAEDHTQHVWGWFRWVPETPGPGAGETGPWLTTPNKSGDHSGGNTYLSGQELADGVYYDSQTKPRPNIFINNEKGGWRHFNNWVFYKDPAKGSNGKYRRILVQENMSVNGREGAVEGATGGALYIFNSTPKATAGPETETFKGPFAVVVNISGAEKFNESGPASSVNVCAANAATGSNEMVLGTVSCEEKKMGTDTIRYYGDEEVYLRLATEASELVVYDFIVYGPGIDLPALKVESITPAGGNTQAEAAPLEASTKEFRVTFNNEITLTEGAKATFGLTSLPPTARAQCTLTLDADKKTVIITPEGELTESGTYALRLEEGSVVDGDDQQNEVLNVFYTVSGVSAIDEVSAAKEVVATHIYSISGAEIPALKSGVNFVKKIYSDGSVTTEKVQVK